jgi:hypothetical protein
MRESLAAADRQMSSVPSVEALSEMTISMSRKSWASSEARVSWTYGSPL